MDECGRICMILLLDDGGEHRWFIVQFHEVLACGSHGALKKNK